MQYRSFAITIIILAIATFLVSGGFAFLTALTGSPQTTSSNPYEISLTPVALALVIIGEMGAYILILAGPNLQHGNSILAKKQLITGFAFLFACDVGFRFLEVINSRL